MEHKFGAKPIVFGTLGLLVLASFCVVFLSIMSDRSRVVIGESSFDTYTALNETDRTKILLGGLETTGKDKALLIFPSDGIHSVPMKNIKNPIDILWLDSNKIIVRIQTTTNSEAGTNIVYKPITPVRYIIELPSGSVNNYAIKVNQVAEFNVKTEDVK